MNKEQDIATIYIDKYFKASDAVARMSGMLEARAEIAMVEGKYEDAIDILRDLVSFHSRAPLGKQSEEWMKGYIAKMDECRVKRFGAPTLGGVTV